VREPQIKRIVTLSAFIVLVCSGHTDAALLSNSYPTGKGAFGIPEVPGQPYGGSFCADVVGDNSAFGTAVQLFNCHGGLNQQFSIMLQTSTNEPANLTLGLTIVAMGGAACLTVPASPSNSLPIPVTIDNCAGASQAVQIWQYVGGQLQINPLAGTPGGCLDSGGPNTPLVINNCNSSFSQQWQIK